MFSLLFLLLMSLTKEFYSQWNCNKQNKGSAYEERIVNSRGERQSMGSGVLCCIQHLNSSMSLADNSGHDGCIAQKRC